MKTPNEYMKAENYCTYLNMGIENNFGGMGPENKLFSTFLEMTQGGWGNVSKIISF